MDGPEQLAIFLAQKAEIIKESEMNAKLALKEVDGVQSGINEILGMLRNLPKEFVPLPQYIDDKIAARDMRESIKALIMSESTSAKKQIDDLRTMVLDHEKLNAPSRDIVKSWGGSLGLSKWAIPIIIGIVTWIIARSV